MCGGSASAALVATDRNREVDTRRFTYQRCSKCGTLFLADVPDDLARYYGNGYYPFGADGEPTWKTNPTLLSVEQFRVRLLARHTPVGPLIDIGAGSGGFAAAARDAGFDVTAIEMDPDCCAYLREGLGVNAICSDRPMEALAQLPAPRVIALWHSLEHMQAPADLIAAAAEKLQPAGVLAIGVPNPRSLQFRVLGGRWPHLDAPRHLCLATAEAIIDRAAQGGLRCVELTTNDPCGIESNLHGWAYGLRRRPAEGPASPALVRTAGVLSKLVAPIERSGNRGAALTILLRKDAADEARSAP